MIASLKRLWSMLLDRPRDGETGQEPEPAMEGRPELYTRPDEAGTVRGMLAYAFQSDLALPEMLKALNERGPWQWIERDSAWYGDYLSAVVKSSSAMIKIFEEEDQFVVSMYYKERGPRAVEGWDQFHDTVLHDVLPGVEARNIERTEAYDPPISW